MTTVVLKGMVAFNILSLVLIGRSDGQACLPGHTNDSSRDYGVERTVTKNRTTVEQYLVKHCCPGYVNISNYCEEGCPEGKYGVNCTENCSCPSYCDKESGECICDPGFHGENCSEGCTNGTYGINCRHTCTCKNNSTCHSIDGACTCTSPGWQGNLCDEECNNNTYGLFCNESCTCNDNQTCDPVNGTCTCKAGWKGENCSEECDDMKYGINCLNNCTCNRDHTKTCDKITGLCACRPGYTEEDCSKECNNNTYGLFCNESCTCNDNQTCDPVNGTCTCKAGWKGENCSEECDDMKYGINCLNNCTCNRDHTKTCDKITGLCACRPGYTEEDCSKECNNNTHGLFCNESCTCNENQTCDPVNGTCTCKAGWKGENCSEGYSRNGTSILKGKQTISSVLQENLVYIILGIIGLIAVVVTVTVICLRKLQIRKSFRPQKEQVFLYNTLKDNPIYDEQSGVEEITLKKCTSQSNNLLYEEDVLEIENQSDLPKSHVTDTDKEPRDIDDKHDAENYDHAYPESNQVAECTVDSYTVPDKNSDLKNENIVNEYNTFGDIKKMHRKEGNREQDIEDYDVISRTGSKKKKLKDLEHYSSFGQVKRLNLQESLENVEQKKLTIHTQKSHLKKTAERKKEDYEEVVLELYNQ